MQFENNLLKIFKKSSFRQLSDFFKSWIRTRSVFFFRLYRRICFTLSEHLYLFIKRDCPEFKVMCEKSIHYGATVHNYLMECFYTIYWEVVV